MVNDCCLKKVAFAAHCAHQLRRPCAVALLTFFLTTLILTKFALDENHYVFHANVTQQLRNETWGSSSTLYRRELIESRIQKVEEKFAKKELEDHFSLIQHITSNLKSDISSSESIFNVDTRRRVILVTTWRSGSTFLAELLSSYPATYYHYEPFTGHGIRRLRSHNESQLATTMMKNLLSCNYKESIDKYRKFYTTKYPELFVYNRALWPRCKVKRDRCLTTEFIDNLCYMYPFQVMKTVRVGLNTTVPILEDPTFSDVRIILLVRDPRGTLASRKHRDWCPKHPDCFKAEQLCQDLVEDYMVASHLKTRFPDRIKVIQYEDITKDVLQVTNELLEFLELPMQPETQKFLKEHCDPDVWKKAKIVPQVWNTFRDPSKTSDKWKTDLKFSEINEIQESCKLAMKLWNYTPIDQRELFQQMREEKMKKTENEFVLARTSKTLS